MNRMSVFRSDLVESTLPCTGRHLTHEAWSLKLMFPAAALTPLLLQIMLHPAAAGGGWAGQVTMSQVGQSGDNVCDISGAAGPDLPLLAG